jgi:hypothetical protein
VKIIGLVLILLVLGSQASAKMHYKWTVETTNYVVEVAKPLGDLSAIGGWDLSSSRERFFSQLADAGYPLFRRMEDEQASTIWLQIKVADHGPCCLYDGALNHLVALTSFGDSLKLDQLLCSPVDPLNDVAAPALTEAVAGVSWDRMLCASGAQTNWLLFAGFPRTVDPGEIRGLVLTKGVAPCAR